jgi:hypothetical protein
MYSVFRILYSVQFVVRVCCSCVGKVWVWGAEEGGPPPSPTPQLFPAAVKVLAWVLGVGRDKINSLCPLTTPPSSLAGRREFTMSRSTPPPIQSFLQSVTTQFITKNTALTSLYYFPCFCDQRSVYNVDVVQCKIIFEKSYLS